MGHHAGKMFDILRIGESDQVVHDLLGFKGDGFGLARQLLETAGAGRNQRPRIQIGGFSGSTRDFYALEARQRHATHQIGAHAALDGCAIGDFEPHNDFGEFLFIDYDAGYLPYIDTVQLDFGSEVQPFHGFGKAGVVFHMPIHEALSHQKGHGAKEQQQGGKNENAKTYAFAAGGFH